MGRPHWNIEGCDLMVKVHTTWDDLIGTSGGDLMVHTTWDDLIGTSGG